MMNRKKLELYVHIPFCIQKCLYCDFLSFTGNRTAQELYVQQLMEEIRSRSVAFEGYQVSTVFLGGGTPSILDKEWIEAILAAISSGFCLEADAEVTIEINPGTVTREKLERYRECGINRISIGLQSTHDKELKSIGRIHSYETFLKSYELVRSTGFTNVNIDLMSALPGQSLDSWKNTLKKVTMLRPEHISAYSLIIEDGTPFYELYGSEQSKASEDLVQLPDEDTAQAIYRMTQSFLKSHGYERYEISNYAKKGFPCLHNMGYWTGTEYLGLGLGASSYVGGVRFKNTENWDTYVNCHMSKDDLEQVLVKDRQELSVIDRMEEFMFLGLRLTEGVSELEFCTRFGHNIWQMYGEVLTKHMEGGMILYESPYIRLSEQGLDVSNYIMCDFLQ